MNKSILELAKKLIAKQSFFGNGKAMSEALFLAREELEDFEIEKFVKGKEVTSFLVTNRKQGERNFEVILNAHLDVVRGKPEQFRPVVRDGRLYGRGAYDMKGAAAVMTVLFKELAGEVKYPLALQLTTDEETGGQYGTGYQMEQGMRGKFVITGEGTDLTIVNESKTRMQFRLTANGKSSHGAYPWKGDNAILKLQGAIYKLNEVFPLPREESSGTTLNVTLIRTNNETFNVTPDHCEAILDARVVPGDKANIKDRIKKTVGTDVAVEVLHESSVHASDKNCVHIKKLAEALEEVSGTGAVFRRAHGESDARYHASVGSQVIEFGPVGANHHADDEWVDIKSLEDYYVILKKFLLSYG